MISVSFKRYDNDDDNDFRFKILEDLILTYKA